MLSFIHSFIQAQRAPKSCVPKPHRGVESVPMTPSCSGAWGRFATRQWWAELWHQFSVTANILLTVRTTKIYSIWKWFTAAVQSTTTP